MTPEDLNRDRRIKEPCKNIGVLLQHHKIVRIAEPTLLWIIGNLQRGGPMANCRFCTNDCGLHLPSRAAKLRSVMQISQCARVNIQIFHRACILLMWCSCSEPMRYENISRIRGVWGRHIYFCRQFCRGSPSHKIRVTLFFEPSCRQGWLVICHMY